MPTCALVCSNGSHGHEREDERVRCSELIRPSQLPLSTNASLPPLIPCSIHLGESETESPGPLTQSLARTPSAPEFSMDLGTVSAAA